MSLENYRILKCYSKTMLISTDEIIIDILHVVYKNARLYRINIAVNHISETPNIHMDEFIDFKNLIQQNGESRYYWVDETSHMKCLLSKIRRAKSNADINFQRQWVSDVEELVSYSYEK